MIKEHYESKIPHLFGAIAVTFGNHIFYIYRKDKTAGWLRRHELEHVEQYRRDGWFRFLALYLYEYLCNRLKGFTKEDAYSTISYEVQARKAEGEYDGKR